MKNQYRQGGPVMGGILTIAVALIVAAAVSPAAYAQCTWTSGPTSLTDTCGNVIIGQPGTPRNVSVTGNMDVINADAGLLTADIIRSTRGGSLGFFVGTSTGFVFQTVNNLILKTGPDAASLQEWLRITPQGVVGINMVPSPFSTNQLEVAGNANFTGTVAGGNIQAKYQDVAEWVPFSGELAPGMVVVLNREKANEVKPSSKPYDTMVAGVVSDRPGLLLGEASENKEKIATTGRLKVRVDATKRPVRIGDLLVTSGKSGMAMVSEPISVGGAKIHRPGTIIGKALEPLPGGQGEILVLLSMQ